MERIPTFILIWLDHEAVKPMIEACAKYPQLQLIVVENRSRFTDTHIRPYLVEQVKEGVIDQYYVYDKNIASNSMMQVRRNHKELIAASKYIITTDGDIIPFADKWLEKQIELMEKYPRVHAVSHHLTLDNLPWAHRPALAKEMVRTAGNCVIHNDCLEVPTGHFFTLVHGPEYARYLNWVHGREVQTDDTHRKFCKLIHKKWIKLKEPSAHHHSWSLYYPGNPYFDLRETRDVKQIFYTNRSCSYWLYTKEHGERFVEQPTFGGSVFNNEYGE
jgi:hypothetical protein